MADITLAGLQHLNLSFIDVEGKNARAVSSTLRELPHALRDAGNGAPVFIIVGAAAARVRPSRAEEMRALLG